VTTSEASNTELSNPELKSGEPWGQIFARVTAAIFGGYALTYAFGAAAAKVLPLRPSESVFLISMLQILVYVGIVLWVFAVSGKKAWTGLLAMSALFMAVTFVA
jgi:hypothetical protein